MEKKILQSTKPITIKILKYTLYIYIFQILLSSLTYLLTYNRYQYGELTITVERCPKWCPYFIPGLGYLVVIVDFFPFFDRYVTITFETDSWIYKKDTTMDLGWPYRIKTKDSKDFLIVLDGKREILKIPKWGAIVDI